MYVGTLGDLPHDNVEVSCNLCLLIPVSLKIMSNVDVDNMVNANGNVKTVFSDINDEDEENGKMISKEKVVPVDHVEEVINRVIVDLGHALYNLKEARYEVPDTPIQEKCITHRDLERALQMMKLQLVTEIRQV